MKKHKIAVALVCVVFLTVGWGAVASGQDLFPARDAGFDRWPSPRFPPGFVGHAGEPLPQPPLYEGWEPWHKVQLPPSNDARTGVPEPGSLVLLIGGGLCLLGWAWRRRRRR